MEAPKKLTNFRLPVGILARLDAFAESECLNRTSALTFILNRNLPKAESQDGESTKEVERDE